MFYQHVILNQMSPAAEDIKMDKKGSSEMWWIIMTAILVIVVLILILIWFKGGAGTLFGGLGEKTKGLADHDKDNTADLFDKCPCTAGEDGAKYDGCPASVDDDSKLKAQDQSCLQTT